MDIIQKRIDAFKTVVPDAQGECHAKTAIVEELEDHLADDRVLSFFGTLIADQSEFDLARLAALKILQMWEAPSVDRHLRVGRQLAKMLPIEEDVLVQQWAAIAAENFVDVPEVFTVLAALLADPSVDLDVRYNCLAAIKRLHGSEEAVRVLRSVVDDKQLRASVLRILSEWGMGKGDG